VPGAGRRFRLLALSRLVLGAACCGCSPRSAPERVEDTLTSGRISIVCASEARDLAARERDAFRALYPQASLQIREGSSREAVRALFAAECDLAVITRELEPEERAAAVRGGLELEGYRVACDALVVVVHPDNPVENLALEDLRRIYRGEFTRWTAVGGADRAIDVVIQPPASDITDFFVQEVMGGEPIRAKSIYETADATVVTRVTGDPDAVGYVSMAAANRGARSLRLAALTGLPYWKPDPEAVYTSKYPLTRYVNVYVRGEGAKLANGFTTFFTSREGQQIVNEAGLVPTAVPVRFVRRSPLMSSH